MTEPFPTLLERKVLPKVWGGRSLQSALDIPLPAGAAIGETWELYDRDDGSSRLRGSMATLRELMQDDGPALLGRGVRPAKGGRFPLLIKFIDAAERLSVQVHPDDAQAAEDDDGGKHEAWVVVATSPGARIVHGLKAGVTRQQFAAAAGSADVEPLLDEFTPRAGDAVMVPPGTVHAIGPGVVLFEIQQNSDVTYRIWDWGRPRELHLDKAMRAARFDRRVPQTVAPEPIGEDGEWLLRCEHFRVRRFRVRTAATLGTEGTVKVLTVLRGGGTIGWRSGGRHEPLIVRAGDTVLVPACTGAVFLSPVTETTILWSDPGSGS